MSTSATLAMSGQQYLKLALESPSWDLTSRQLCDVELLLNGAFAPLQGFLTQSDYDSVVDTLRLASGELWPIPVTLDVSSQFAELLEPGQQIVLRDAEFVVIALMTVENIWRPDKLHEAKRVFGTTDTRHPGVDYLLHRAGDFYLGGKLEAVELPPHYDFRQHRHTPQELKDYFTKLGWQRIVAFHTHSPMHRMQQALTSRIVRELEANLLIHPVIGFSQPGSIDHYTRVRCYERILGAYPEQTTMLSLVNLAMRMAGPREALWHALIRKNYGCSHFLVNSDHASPLRDTRDASFYDPQAALALTRQHANEIGMEIVGCDSMVWVQERAEYLPASQTESSETVLDISEAEFLRRLREDVPLPEWFSYPDILEEIRKTYPPRHRQGFTVFFTGLSGSGKSTIANALRVKLLELGGRPVTLLDGDVVRKNLSSELTFSKEHRDLNIRRIGFVAGEITKNGGIAICAPIAPYASIRREVREIVDAVGGFMEVHVSTPLEECERRDRKGLYAKARAGLVKHFTGIDDPYEVPEDPEVRLDTTDISPDECAQFLLLKLEKLGFIKV